MNWIEGLILIGVMLLLITTGMIVNYKWKTPIIRWGKKYRVFKFIVNILVPFVVPFILSIVFIDPDELNENKWLFVVILVSMAVVIVNFVFQFWYWKQDRDESMLRWENSASKHAYMGLYRIHKDKKAQYSAMSLKNETINTQYDIYDHIRKICLEFANTIGDITGIPAIHISVSFIYRFPHIVGETTNNDDDQEWRWIIGRNSKFNMSLGNFIKQKNSMYHHMIHNNIPFVFYNDKKDAVDQGVFYYSAKDKLHDNSGSIFASKFGFNNNERICCEGLLMITTYGEKLVKANSEYTEADFEQLLLDKIFPCYKNLLQTELGLLYFKEKRSATKSQLLKRGVVKLIISSENNKYRRR